MLVGNHLSEFYISKRNQLTDLDKCFSSEREISAFNLER